MKNFPAKYFTFFIALTLLLLISSKQVFAAVPKTVKVAAFNNYPVIFKDTDGKIKGLYVDLLTEIGQKENINIEYVFSTWSEGLEQIKSGEVDLLTSVAYTDNRALFMDYGKSPLLTVWGELYIQPTSSISSLLDLPNKKIGVMAGDVNYKNFEELLTKFEISCQWVEFTSYNEVFKAIQDGQVDAGIAGVTFGESNLGKFGLKSAEIVFNPINIYFTTAKGKNQELLTLLDSYLVKWHSQENSIFDQAKQKWMYGDVNTTNVIPTWIYFALLIFGFTALVTSIFIILLKRQVNTVLAKDHQQTNLLSAITENVNEAVFAKDIQDGKVGKYTFINSAGAKMLGLSQKEIIGKTDAELLSNRLSNTFTTTDNEVIASGQALEKEDELILEDNKSIFLSHKSPLRDSTGKIIGLIGTSNDITERKINQAKIAAISEKYIQLIKFTKTGFLVCDANGTVLDANEEYALLTGHSKPEEIIGRNLSEWTATEELSKNAKILEDCKRLGFISNFEIDYVSKNGEIITIILNAFAEGTNGGLKITALCSDISERKQKELKKDELFKQMEVTNNTMIDRELKMVELKKENLQLKDRIRILEDNSK